MTLLFSILALLSVAQVDMATSTKKTEQLGACLTALDDLKESIPVVNASAPSTQGRNLFGHRGAILRFVFKGNETRLLVFNQQGVTEIRFPDGVSKEYLGNIRLDEKLVKGLRGSESSFFVSFHAGDKHAVFSPKPLYYEEGGACGSGEIRLFEMAPLPLTSANVVSTNAQIPDSELAEFQSELKAWLLGIQGAKKFDRRESKDLATALVENCLGVDDKRMAEIIQDLVRRSDRNFSHPLLSKDTQESQPATPGSKRAR